MEKTYPESIKPLLCSVVSMLKIFDWFDLSKKVLIQERSPDLGAHGKGGGGGNKEV